MYLEASLLDDIAEGNQLELGGGECLSRSYIHHSESEKDEELYTDIPF